MKRKKGRCETAVVSCFVNMLLEKSGRRLSTSGCLTVTSSLVVVIVVVFTAGGFRESLAGITQKSTDDNGEMENSTANGQEMWRVGGLTDTGVGEQVVMSTEVNGSLFVEKRYDSIFYLKMHKTGSTLLAHHLSEYLKRHSLRSIKAPGHIFISVQNNVTEIQTATLDNGTTIAKTDLVRADAIVRHHFNFDWDVILSYLKKPPKLVLTSMRLPLQRQLSWFRQQNRQWDTLNCSMISRNDTRSLITLGIQSGLLKVFDNFTKTGRMIASQSDVMTESSARSTLYGNLPGILAQFDFVFLKERLVESLECFCKRFDVQLCSTTYPATRTNYGGSDSCIERILFASRIKAFAMYPEDHLLYEIVNQRLSHCQRDIPAHCRCPTK